MNNNVVMYGIPEPVYAYAPPEPPYKQNPFQPLFGCEHDFKVDENKPQQKGFVKWRCRKCLVVKFTND